MTHYYILPDGRKALTMKDARKDLDIGTDAFRSLVIKGIIKKVIISKAHSDDKIEIQRSN